MLFQLVFFFSGDGAPAETPSELSGKYHSCAQSSNSLKTITKLSKSPLELFNFSRPFLNNFLVKWLES